MSGSNASTHWIRSNYLPGVELLSSTADPTRWRWFHETYSICACEAADADWRYRHADHQLKDGSVMLLEPGEMHCTTRVRKPARFKVILFSPDTFTALSADLGMPMAAHFRCAQVDSVELFNVVWRLGRAIEAGATALAQQVLLAQTVRAVAEYAERAPGAPHAGREKKAVERAKSYLQDRYQEPITLDQLSVAAGVSRFGLIRAFNRAVGMAPHAWQNLLRIERSRQLLMRGAPPISVAAEMGFYDQAHFTRHFKRIMRVTPTEYTRESAPSVPEYVLLP